MATTNPTRADLPNSPAPVPANISSLVPVSRDERISETTRETIEQSRADSTNRAHVFDWDLFCKWCAREGRNALPATAETVAEFVTYLDRERGYSVTSIPRKIAAISFAHNAAKHESPTGREVVKSTLRGLKRIKARNGAKVLAEGKDPIRLTDLSKMLKATTWTLRDVRDRALMLLGYYGAFRRSELSNVQMDALTFKPEGVLIRIPFSKTNQTGEQREQLDICRAPEGAWCPVRELEHWIESAKIESGPVFRPLSRAGNPLDSPLSGHSMNKIVKRWGSRAGMDASRVGFHSLRSGRVTDMLADAETGETDVMHVTRHKSVEMVARYDRPEPFARDYTKRWAMDKIGSGRACVLHGMRPTIR